MYVCVCIVNNVSIGVVGCTIHKTLHFYPEVIFSFHFATCGLRHAHMIKFTPPSLIFSYCK